MSAFSRYIGIDYSGAETPEVSLKGLRVYIAVGESAANEVPPPPSPRKYWSLRGLTIFDVLISTLFEVWFPFRFPHTVGESGKRNGEVSFRGGVVDRFAGAPRIRFG